METIPIEDLVKLLNSNELIVRTGLWLVPAKWNINVAGLAARFNMDALDMRQVWLDQLPSGVKMAGIRRERLLEIISNIADQQNLSDCALLYNLDLLISGLPLEDRIIFWHHSIKGLPHKARALLFLFPDEAYENLIDPENRINWQGSGRITVTQ
jgi:hypothetical protein